ncbi:MAG: hypothetical protein PHF65_07910 [Oscillospiraceae bacterium]|nr:hypothetical protein [Oscillospiraceae bacterium]
MMSNTLIFRQIRKNWVEAIILIVFVYFITGSVLGITREIDTFTRSTRIFQKAGLENDLFYSYRMSASISAMPSEISEIQMIPGVSNVGTISYSTLEVTEGGIWFRLILSDSPELNKVRYPLSDGKYPSPDEPNHVLLPPHYQQYFDVGDTIEMFFYNYDNFFTTDEFPTVRVTVSGFFQHDKTMSFNVTTPDMDVGHLFEVLPYTGWACGLVDTSGQPLQGSYNKYLIITPESNEDLSRLKKDVSDVVQSKDFVHIGRDMVSQYWKNHDDQLRSLFISGLSLFLLAFSFLLAGTYLSVILSRKELAVYHLSGLPWKSCVNLIMIPKLIAFLFGYSSGVFRYVLQSGFIFRDTLSRYLNRSDIFISFGLLIFLLVAGTFPFYLSALRQSPLDVYRKD